MNWPIRYCFLILIICCLLPGWGVGQCTLYGEYSYLEPRTYNGEFWVGIHNPLVIRRRDGEFVDSSNVEITLSTWKSTNAGQPARPLPSLLGRYGDKVRPDSVGTLRFLVTTPYGKDTLCARAVPLPMVPMVGSFDSKDKGAIAVNVFKSQFGVHLQNRGGMFDMRIPVFDFEVIRVGADGYSQRTHNQGGKWDEGTKKLIFIAQPGDVYVFRNIRYRSPGIEKLQVAEPLIIELK